MGFGYNIVVAVFAAIGAFLFGYDSGIITSVISPDYHVFRRDFNSPGDDLTGAIVSVFAGGCFFGAGLAGYSANRFGRKRTIQLGCAIALLGCSLQTGAHNIATLLIGRLITGFAIGVLSMITPLYQSETAHPKYRGFLVGTTQQMIGVGFITANWIGYGCQYLENSGQYRLPLGIQLIPAVLLLVGMQFCPFSPRWLIEQGREEEARRALTKLHGNGKNDEWLDKQFTEMVEQIRYEKVNESHSWKELVNTRPMLKRTLLACGVQMFGQCTGINFINYYGPEMYRLLGIPEGSGQYLLITGIYGVVGPITNFFFITFLIDRVGRKIPLAIGSFGIAVALSVEAAINSEFDPEKEEEATNLDAQRAGITMFFLASIIFSISYGPISWVYVSEIFPMRVRAQGNAVATMSNWALNVLFAQTGLRGMNAIRWKFYLIWVIINICTGLIVIFFFVETKGRTLEEMDALFDDQRISHALADGRASGIASGRLTKADSFSDLSKEAEVHTEHHQKGEV